MVEGGGGEGGLGRAGRLQASDPREAFHARPQVSCFQGSGFGFGFTVQGSGLGSKLQSLSVLCRGLVHEESRSQHLGRSTAHRRDYPSIGCLQCLTTTSTGMGWTGGRAERLRDVAGTRLLKRQTPHPLALPHIKTET